MNATKPSPPQARASVWQTIGLFLRLTRPLFLAGGVLLYLLGAFLAWQAGFPFSLNRLILAQLVVTSIQLMTHYANEYFDQESDRLNDQRTWFSGGSGVLADGKLAAWVPLAAALAAGAAGLIFLVLIGFQIPVMWALGGFSLLVGWFYSAPPPRLVSSGFGELFASSVVTGTVPLMGFAAQSGGPIHAPVLLASFSLSFLHLAMLIAFQIPDYAADLQANKRTIAVRLGLPHTAVVHNLSLLAGMGSIALLGLSGWEAARPALLVIPLAVWQALSLKNYVNPPPTGRKPRSYAGLTFRALAIFALASALWLAGVILYPHSLIR